MRGAISYSLFGYGKTTPDNCFEFNTYLRGLSINVRLARLLFPEFEVVLHLDKETYEGFKAYFDSMPIRVVICEAAPLTKAMLWRMKPCFEHQYTHVLCRDLDSPLSYRERQAVEYWINRDKAAHAITDSVSHDVAMLGGMIGFRPQYFSMRTGFNTWEDMFSTCGYDFTKKGNDQMFLTNFIYPKFAQHGTDSITQHYLKGMPHSFLSDCHNKIQDLELPIPFEYKDSNDSCVHIGQSGWNETGTFKFLLKHWDKFTDILDAESKFPNVFYWNL